MKSYNQNSVKKLVRAKKAPDRVRKVVWFATALLSSFVLFPYVFPAVIGLTFCFVSPVVGRIESAFMPLDKRVNLLIDAHTLCTRPGRWEPFVEYSSPREIATLGEPAIPYLVRRLDDTSPVPMGANRELTAAD